MDGDSIFPPVRTAAIDDPDRLAAALRDANVEYLRLGPSPYTATLTAIELGPVCLQIAADHAHISRGHVATDRSLLLLGLDLAEGGRTRLNGIDVARHDIIHLGPGAPLFAHVLAPIEWAAISFRTDALDHAIPPEHLARVEDFRLHSHGTSHAALAGFLRHAGMLSRRDPARLAVPAVRRAMADDAFRLCLSTVWDAPVPDAPLRAVRRRVALVRQVEDLLATRIGEPLYSEDLQQALGVPMRTIHNAFAAVLGMSAHRYLRIRRLHLARAMLRAGTGNASLVKIAALTHGFWHLGRFARDYQDLFGELPSQTATDAHGALLSMR